jgi:hypothetical protein
VIIAPNPTVETLKPVFPRGRIEATPAGAATASGGPPDVDAAVATLAAAIIFRKSLRVAGDDAKSAS